MPQVQYFDVDIMDEQIKIKNPIIAALLSALLQEPGNYTHRERRRGESSLLLLWQFLDQSLSLSLLIGFVTAPIF
jgi:hypothetical protein